MIYSIGHSNKPERFFALLERLSIGTLFDVRARAHSRFPDFTGGALQRQLRGAYKHLPALGGHRYAVGSLNPDNLWWGDNPTFHSLADSLTPSNREAWSALDLIADAGRSRPVAIMCAERSSADCHRQLLCDILASTFFYGVPVLVAGEDSEPFPWRISPTFTKLSERHPVWPESEEDTDE